MQILLGRDPSVARAIPGLFAVLVLLACSPRLAATTLFISGDLRANATVTSCGTGCTLGPLNTDADFAQWAAVVTPFTVNTTSTMQAITYSYAGGTSLTGASVAAGGLEPYLSLFDSGGNFMASTLLGTTCPPGANSLGGNCFDVMLSGVTLTPGKYFIALTAYSNMSLAENGGIGTLADGFTGLGNLATGESLHYAFDVILPTNVPEPRAASLLWVGLLALSLHKRLSRTITTNKQEETK